MKTLELKTIGIPILIRMPAVEGGSYHHGGVYILDSMPLFFLISCIGRFGGITPGGGHSS